MGGVALATAVRLVFGAHLLSPFPTYHPVIILVTFVGGLGPGLLAVGLATLISSYTFLQPYLSSTLGSAEIFSLAVFIILSLVNVAAVAFLYKKISSPNRRDLMLGGSVVAAAAAFGSAVQTRTALAADRPAAVAASSRTSL